MDRQRIGRMRSRPMLPQRLASSDGDDVCDVDDVGATRP
jgi:hypothetical protein